MEWAGGKTSLKLFKKQCFYLQYTLQGLRVIYQQSLSPIPMSFGYEKLLGGPHTGIRQGNAKSLVSIGNTVKETVWPQRQGAAGSSPLALAKKCRGSGPAPRSVGRKEHIRGALQHPVCSLCCTEYIQEGMTLKTQGI